MICLYVSEHLIIKPVYQSAKRHQVWKLFWMVIL